ncbi:DUF4118 domain-containing protein [Cellulomonas sp. P22]|uniref:DUF4118 domain-containing protein n=1 Tax=Cellulomonas sp. P22 TaxID=3373189 RepID=UPI00379BC70C
MDIRSFVRDRRGVLVVLAALAPLVVSAALAPFRDTITSTTVALALVLVVVGAAATGSRPAGFVAALSAGAWFDFFLTAPYNSFKIDDADDIQATVLLLLIGFAVSEIALWGLRQESAASRRAGYLTGVIGTAEIVAARGESTDALVDHVSRQIVEVLGVDACGFEPLAAQGRSSACLEHDGSVTQRGRPVDVERHGLPSDDVIGLEVRHGGVGVGRFVLTAATRVVSPTLEQRRVAVLLADQVGAALANPAG